jgi:hypothetical protein
MDNKQRVKNLIISVNCKLDNTLGALKQYHDAMSLRCFYQGQVDSLQETKWELEHLLSCMELQEKYENDPKYRNFVHV